MRNNKVKKKHLLIIGGTGFIGYHCFNFAKKYNWKLTSVSRKNPSIARKVEGVNYLKININNTRQIKKNLNKNFTHIINSVGSSNQVFAKINKNSIKKTQFIESKNIIDFFINKKIDKFIQIGSAAEYGQKPVPHKESIKCLPKSDYGREKLKTSKYLLNLFQKKYLNGIVVRLFQVYGEGQERNKIIPYIVRNCLLNKKFNLSKGNQTRDFCHISDAVKAIFLLLNTKKIVNGKIYNIASGKDVSIKKLTLFIKDIIGFGKPIFGRVKLKKNEIIKSKADIREIKKLGWSSKINLESGIKLLIKNK